MQTANEAIKRQDMRMMRAQQLLRAVLECIDPYLDAENPRARREVYQALIGLFHDEGVDVITDAARADAGLPPRGPDGWTIEEIVALERRRLDILTAPIRMMAPPPTDTQ